MMEQAQADLAALVADDQVYLPLLGDLLRQASAELGDDTLRVVLTGADRSRLTNRWAQWTGQWVAEQALILDDEILNDVGGVIVYSNDRARRVDNSFTGRATRLEQVLRQLILEQLFAGAMPMGGLQRG